jgi:OmpA-OmpF porin, OOP family
MPRLVHALPMLLVSSAASAQSMQLDDFRPAIDSRGYLTLNASDVLDHADVSFGLGSLQWGRHLLAFENGPATYSVDHVITATLVAAFGVRAGPVPLALAASLPLTIMSGSRGPDALGDPNDPNDDRRYRLDGQGVGDFGLHVKTRLVRRGRFGLGALASVFVPTGSSRDPFLGEARTTPQVTAIADVSLGPVRVAVNGGIRLRRTTTFMDMGAGGAPATMGSITTSTALPVGVGVAWGVVPEKVELVGEVFGSIPLGDHHGYQPLEALGGVKVYLAKSSYLSLGAGRGLLPDRAGNPDFRGMIGIVFEPKPAQRAAAHVPAEWVAVAPPPQRARDEFLDRDNDGIADADDRCPDDPENYNGVEDDDGCPDRDVVIEENAQIVTLEPIEFEFDKAIIRPSSHYIVDAVVKFMQDHPAIRLVEVQGHTDEQGSDAYNLDLSKRRAAAVVRYLTEHGVDADRLRSEGFGERRLLDRSGTPAAHAKNRRVEFHIKH